MKALALLLSMLILGVASPAALAQDAGGGLVILKFSWDKERIRPRASVSPLASQDELIRQSQRERQLAAARNSSDRNAVSRIETQIGNHDEAVAKARQTELPRDGYRYRLTLRNDSVKLVKSVDWDYVFFDPITQQELARHQFTSDETIKPGKSKEVSVLYFISPVKTVDVRLIEKKRAVSFTEQVVVARIQFSDGSVWQRH